MINTKCIFLNKRTTLLLKILALFISCVANNPHIQAQSLSGPIAVVQERSRWAVSGNLLKSLSPQERSTVRAVARPINNGTPSEKISLLWANPSTASILMPKARKDGYEILLSSTSRELFRAPVRVVTRSEFAQRAVATQGVSLNIPSIQLASNAAHYLTARLGSHPVTVLSADDGTLRVNVPSTARTGLVTLLIQGRIGGLTFKSYTLPVMIQQIGMPRVSVETNANSPVIAKLETPLGSRIELLVKRKNGMPYALWGYRVTRSDGYSFTIQIPGGLLSPDKLSTSSLNEAMYWPRFQATCSGAPVQLTADFETSVGVYIPNTGVMNYDVAASAVGSYYVAGLPLPDTDPEKYLLFRDACSIGLDMFKEMCSSSDIETITDAAKSCAEEIINKPGNAGDELQDCLKDSLKDATEELARRFVFNICQTDAMNAAGTQREREELLRRCSDLVGEANAICNLPKVLGRKEVNICEAIGDMGSPPISAFDLKPKVSNGMLPSSNAEGLSTFILLKGKDGIQQDGLGVTLPTNSIINLNPVELTKEMCESLKLPTPTPTPTPRTNPIPQGSYFKLESNIVNGFKACLQRVAFNGSSRSSAVCSTYVSGYPGYVELPDDLKADEQWELVVSGNSTQGAAERDPFVAISLIQGNSQLQVGGYSGRLARKSTCHFTPLIPAQPCYYE